MSVGIDIGSKSIKVVELGREGNKFRLKAAGVVGYSGVVIDSIQKDDKAFVSLVEVIRKLFKDAKISGKEVAIALAESQVFTRVVTFPPLTDSEIASAVKWEAEQYIPMPVSEAIIQHQILERRENEKGEGVLVLLVAVSKDLVKKYVEILEAAGLNCIAAETELMALARSLAPAEQTVVLVDFGASSTDIAVVKNEQLVFSRSIPMAGMAFTRAVAQSLGVAEKQAEEYKRAYGLSTTRLEGKVQKALDPIFRVVAEEIKKAIHFYQVEGKGDIPSSVILAGGTAGMPDMVSQLTKLIGIEVVVGNPFSKIVIDPEIAKQLVDYAPLYPIAVGLAMREG